MTDRWPAFATLRRWIAWPYRVWRERISVQMIVSYLAMVLLVLILFEATVLGSILLNPGDRFFSTDQVTIDPYLGERSAAYVQWLDPDNVSETISGFPWNLGSLDSLNNDLLTIARGEVPGLQQISPVSKQNPSLVLIADTRGRVIATSDSRIPIYSSVSQLPGEVARTVERNRSLMGALDPSWNAPYSLSLSGDRTVVAYPIVNSENTWVGTFVLEGGSVSFTLGQTRGEFFRQISIVFLQSLWLFAIPALLVAIPFGIWRANIISTRLERLADASERMSRGELNTRIRVRKRDEIGRLAESFNVMAEQIDANDRARRAFISNVSHELRTPVSIILGNVEQMQELPEARPEAIQRPLSTIQLEGTMLVRLVDDLFTSSRLQESNLPLQRESIKLSELVNSLLGGIQPSAWRDRKVSVESIVSPDLPPVLADPQRLQQILSNLIYNALRHTPKGGLVVIQADQRGDTVAVQVTDTGLGMDDQTAANAFDRYYQSERNKRHGDGTGLGLSIVKQLVEAHGGVITVESQQGIGTTFTFTLPVA
ncbi:MAG: HAMP domain-containing histidine kinase [Thermomicrobiales bacterium]|nr:HAMP domain-containing histidine kinase [Thermomicrobiales bacterium]